MKRKILTALAVLAALALCMGGALAADVFRFEDKSLELFEGDSLQAVLVREGGPAEEGTLTWSSSNEKAATVSQEGLVTALKKGKATVKVVLKTEKRSWSANLSVNVLRRVTAVTLNTGRLQIYRPEDPAVKDLLRAETTRDVIVIPAGRSVELRATCTPEDASSRKVDFISSDERVLKAGNTSARAIQAGECELTVQSEQNPEVRQVFHVLVIQPVTKVNVTSPEGKTVGIGRSLALKAETSPANASISEVTWRSRNEQVATVDANGVVTGKKKGTVTIEADAADGSGRSDAVAITVTQLAEQITLREESLYLAAGQLGYAHATVLPMDTNDKGIVWSSTDNQIATVTAGGQVKGLRRGECTIIAASKTNPEVYAELPVEVIQRVTSIEFPGGQVSLPIRTTAQLTWQVLPEDATIKGVTFSSSNRNVATVDSKGLVTGLKRGTSTITATATDGSNRKGQVRVTVTQPVEGISIQYQVYHVQLERSLNIKAILSPSNANNQNVHFTMGDEYIATVKDRKNIGTVRGWHEGTTTITGTSEDGGFSATAEVRVADFNRAIVVDDLYLEGDNIRISLRNRGNFTVDRVYFTVETFDDQGQPLVCNADGVSNFFEGSYRYQLGPEERSQHYVFNFGDYVQPLTPIMTVRLTVTGWRDTEGYTRNIPEEDRPSQTFNRFVPGSVPGGYYGNGNG